MKENKQLYFYPAVFYLEENGSYTVQFPDFDYIATQGTTIQEAYEKASEVLGIGIEDALTGEIKLPVPSAAKDIKPDFEIGDVDTASVVVVTVDMKDWLMKYSMKTVRRNITLPESLDIALRNRKVNVSKICQDALMDAVEIK